MKKNALLSFTTKGSEGEFTLTQEKADPGKWNLIDHEGNAEGDESPTFADLDRADLLAIRELCDEALGVEEGVADA